MIKNFNEFVGEKFDYTKQKNQFDLSKGVIRCKKGDKLYYVSKDAHDFTTATLKNDLVMNLRDGGYRFLFTDSPDKIIVSQSGVRIVCDYPIRYCTILRPDGSKNEGYISTDYNLLEFYRNEHNDELIFNFLKDLRFKK